MSETKYVVKFTTQFKKDFKLAMKRGFKMDLLEEDTLMVTIIRYSRK